jgi:hypothetical protein
VPPEQAVTRACLLLLYPQDEFIPNPDFRFGGGKKK